MIQDVEIALGLFTKAKGLPEEEDAYHNLNHARQALYTYVSGLEAVAEIPPHITKRFE